MKWFRKRLKRWLRRFRKIKKNKAYLALMRSNFKVLTGMAEKKFYDH